MCHVFIHDKNFMPQPLNFDFDSLVEKYMM